jgi:hypothetical protein
MTMEAASVGGLFHFRLIKRQRQCVTGQVWTVGESIEKALANAPDTLVSAAHSRALEILTLFPSVRMSTALACVAPSSPV